MIKKIKQLFYQYEDQLHYISGIIIYTLSLIWLGTAAAFIVINTFK